MPPAKTKSIGLLSAKQAFRAIDISYSFSLLMFNPDLALSLCFIDIFKSINMIIQSKNFIEAAGAPGAFFLIYS